MNIFELSCFGINVTCGYFVGKVAAAKAGLLGWLIGAPMGFFAGVGVMLGILIFLRRTLRPKKGGDRAGKDTSQAESK